MDGNERINKSKDTFFNGPTSFCYQVSSAQCTLYIYFIYLESLQLVTNWLDLQDGLDIKNNVTQKRPTTEAASWFLISTLYGCGCTIDRVPGAAVVAMPGEICFTIGCSKLYENLKQ